MHVPLLMMVTALPSRGPSRISSLANAILRRLALLARVVHQNLQQSQVGRAGGGGGRCLCRRVGTFD
jgi:hypothetical protein